MFASIVSHKRRLSFIREDSLYSIEAESHNVEHEQHINTQLNICEKEQAAFFFLCRIKTLGYYFLIGHKIDPTAAHYL